MNNDCDTSLVKIVIASDLDYDFLIAEIYYDDKYVALINQENGQANLEIVFPGIETAANQIQKIMGLECFKYAIERAEEALLDGT